MDQRDPEEEEQEQASKRGRGGDPMGREQVQVGRVRLVGCLGCCRDRRKRRGCVLWGPLLVRTVLTTM